MMPCLRRNASEKSIKTHLRQPAAQARETIPLLALRAGDKRFVRSSLRSRLRFHSTKHLHPLANPAAASIIFPPPTRFNAEQRAALRPHALGPPQGSLRLPFGRVLPWIACSHREAGEKF
ncbi:MAG: hypothetical protein ACYC3I_07425 [Gemmataceae bacterium]